MQWFLAKIVFTIISGQGKHAPQFDEQLRLINAIDELDAFEQARRIGQKEQVSFESEQSWKVEWQFIDIPELHQFSGLIHGAEIYSKIHEQDDGVLYSDVIRKKAEHIRDRLLHPNLQQI